MAHGPKKVAIRPLGPLATAEKQKKKARQSRSRLIPCRHCGVPVTPATETLHIKNPPKYAQLNQALRDAGDVASVAGPSTQTLPPLASAIPRTRRNARRATESAASSPLPPSQPDASPPSPLPRASPLPESSEPGSSGFQPPMSEPDTSGPRLGTPAPAPAPAPRASRRTRLTGSVDHRQVPQPQVRLPDETFDEDDEDADPVRVRRPEDCRLDEDLDGAIHDEEWLKAQDGVDGYGPYLSDLLFELECATLGPLDLDETQTEAMKRLAYRLRNNCTRRGFEQLYTVGNGTYISLETALSYLRSLSNFTTRKYHCCKNSCCCYAGHLAALEECPYCHFPRRRANGSPHKIFEYIPLIPQLQALFLDPKMVELLSYRHDATQKSDPNTISDYFDCALFRELLETEVVIDGVPQGRKFFADATEIALGLTTDGFSVFKDKKHAAWPIILVLYNLPPEIRIHLLHLISLGVIPGPRGVKDLGSFLEPFIEDALKLAGPGVRTLNIVTKKMFMLRAHCIKGFGDLPAVAKMLKIKGHNGYCPCRFCKITGVRAPGAGTTLYVPLDRSMVADAEPRVYDPANLPMRTHEGMVADALWVHAAPNATEAKRRSRDSGVNGLTVLARLPSISLPWSFPLEFMHAIWENVIPNIVELMRGKYKELDSSSFALDGATWDAIGVVTQECGAMIPGAFGRCVPDFIANTGVMTAEAWSFWTLYIAPVVLFRQFRRHQYYTHFMQLVELLKVALQFDIRRSQVDELEQGFIDWVQQYEVLYFQKQASRLSTCPVTIHNLLHLAECIRNSGPPAVYWSFLTERFCGHLKLHQHSRRYPYAELDNFVRERAQLRIITLQYRLDDVLHPPKPNPAGWEEYNRFSFDEYPRFFYETPRDLFFSLPQATRKAIGKHLSTRLSKYRTHDDPTEALVNRDLIVRALPNTVQRYGKVRFRGEGDVMHAANVGTTRADARDATYVRYIGLVDKHMNRRNAPPEFRIDKQYGQLLAIYAFKLPANPLIRLFKPQQFVLAEIKPCVLYDPSPLSTHPSFNISNHNRASIEIVDSDVLSCSVGRIYRDSVDGYIVDRSDGEGDPILVAETPSPRVSRDFVPDLASDDLIV